MRKVLFPILFLTGFSSPLLAGTINGHLTAKSPELLKDAIVYIRKADGIFKPKPGTYKMDQQNLTFTPHVLPILVGTTVTFQNSDRVNHNVFSPDGKGYDLGTWGSGGTKTYTFSEPGIYTQLCNIHPEMEAFIIVLQNPYFARPGPDGTFTLNGIPAGEYELKVWHPKIKGVGQKVNVGSGVTTIHLEL